MNDERLWAPWRLGYITGETKETSCPEPKAWREGADTDCFLCRAAAEYADAESRKQLLVVQQSQHSVVVLNRFPYNNGHLLISPARHVGDLIEMTAEEHAACLQSIASLIAIYRRTIHAEGFNIGLNLGRVAGAGVPGHLHWHLVPRWPGDNNFMPVLAGIRVIPQSLDELWEMLVGVLPDRRSQERKK